MTEPDRQRLEDAVLVLRAQAGAERAFTRLFERYEKRLLYYLRRVAGPDAADDAFGETWLKAFRGIGRLERPAAFRPWLYRIGRNAAIDVVRRRGREIPLDDPRARDAVEAHVEEEDEPAYDDEDVALLHGALERISPIHREVLTLQLLEDLSYEEIADVVGVPVGTVRSRLHNARRSLGREIEALRRTEPIEPENGGIP